MLQAGEHIQPADRDAPGNDAAATTCSSETSDAAQSSEAKDAGQSTASSDAGQSSEAKRRAIKVRTTAESAQLDAKDCCFG